MKLSTKIISSPGRAEKYPTQPPLMMRFLRSSVGGRSRGRSRSSPMFVRKKNNTTAIDTQEPTSPKVTCMGQVRVKRSKTQPGQSIPRRVQCNWVHKNALFCHFFNGKFKSFSLKPTWEKWVSFSHCNFYKKVKKHPNFEPRSEASNQGSKKEEEDEDSEQVGRAKVNAFNSVSPPKNALLLTRCRSAPYKSSSLAVKFWGSPVNHEKTEQEQTQTEHVNKEAAEEDDSESPGSKGVSVSKESSDQESTRLVSSSRSSSSESEGKIGFFKELEDPISSIRENFEELRRTNGKSIGPGPLVLTRCKSEPARIGEKLYPETHS